MKGDANMSAIPSLDDLYDEYPEVMGERPDIVICSKKISENLDSDPEKN
jgi:hypothetical protein